MAVEVAVEVLAAAKVKAEVEAAAGTVESVEAVQARWAVQDKASGRAGAGAGKAELKPRECSCGSGGWWGKGCGRWRALGTLPSLLAREPEARTERNVQVEVAQ